MLTAASTALCEVEPLMCTSACLKKKKSKKVCEVKKVQLGWHLIEVV